MVVGEPFVTVEDETDLVKCQLEVSAIDNTLCNVEFAHPKLWVTPGCYILSYKIQVVSIFN